MTSIRGLVSCSTGLKSDYFADRAQMAGFGPKAASRLSGNAKRKRPFEGRVSSRSANWLAACSSRVGHIQPGACSPGPCASQDPARQPSVTPKGFSSTNSWSTATLRDSALSLPARSPNSPASASPGRNGARPSPAPPCSKGQNGPDWLAVRRGKVAPLFSLRLAPKRRHILSL
jgi:hypothetical protein